MNNPSLAAERELQDIVDKDSRKLDPFEAESKQAFRLSRELAEENTESCLRCHVGPSAGGERPDQNYLATHLWCFKKSKT